MIFYVQIYIYHSLHSTFTVRYAVSVMWELDAAYNVQKVWYGRTVIRSRYKLFYEVGAQG